MRLGQFVKGDWILYAQRRACHSRSEFAAADTYTVLVCRPFGWDAWEMRFVKFCCKKF
jgi:hypothetical protein